MNTPLDLLLPFQRDWVLDPCRFKIWLASRQIGKSFAAAAEVVRESHLHARSHWLILSAGRDQALEFMRKVRDWCEAFDLVLDYDAEETTGGEWKKAEIVLRRNGARITALSANPDTGRGNSANVVFDEFAVVREADELWRAVYPSITNPLKGELKLRVLSTPKGMGNRFHRIWAEAGPEWSRHKVTIEDAFAGGLKVNIPELRRQAGDEDTFRQEFLCEFIDGSRSAFPYEVIAACEDTEWTAWDFQPSDGMGPLYLGIDVGSLSDPTVAALYELRPGSGILTLRHWIEIRETELSDQDRLLAPLVRAAARVSIDASGLGLDIAQRLRRGHGGKIIVQPTTAKWKREAFAALQRRFLDRMISIPSEKRIREDLHSYEVSGAGETARYTAPRNADGHSDFTSATVHAADAASRAVDDGTWTTEATADVILARRDHRLPRRRRAIA